MAETLSPIAAMKRLFEPLLGDGGRTTNADDAAVEAAHGVASELTALIEERARLRHLEEEETAKLADLRGQLQAREAERIEAITDFRVSTASEDKDRADALLQQCNAIQREIEDANAVARGIKARVESLDVQIKDKARVYRVALGAFLNSVYARLIDQYNEAAPAVAEIVLQLAAVARVMRRYSTGSFAGWNGAMLLPGMRAGENGTIEPLLDAGSTEFDRDATDRMALIFAEMRAAGFVARLD